jgi:hypothetical protein
MKKYFIILLFLASCRDPIGFQGSFDTIMEIRIGSSATLSDNVKIGFEDVLNDSRCPADAMCVWEGKADLSFWLQRPGLEKQYFKCPIYGYVHKNDTTRQKSINVQTYKITVMQLDPYPEIVNPIIKSNYTATIKISTP